MLAFMTLLHKVFVESLEPVALRRILCISTNGNLDLQDPALRPNTKIIVCVENYTHRVQRITYPPFHGKQI